MKFGVSRRRIAAVAAGVLSLSASIVGAAPAQAATTLTWLVDDGEQTLAVANAEIAAFQKRNPTIKVVLHKRIATDANAVMTKLAAGNMEDIFSYNTGSLFQALNPAKTIVDLTKEPFMKDVSASFKPAVKAGGKVYGVPYGPAMGGGIMYNRKVFAKLGLQVPTTWAQFMANNAKLKAAGIPAVIGSYGEPWTAQVMLLADFYNVQAAVPNFAAQYTAGKANYQFTSAATAGFQHLSDIYDGGYLQKNYSTTMFIDALNMLANGDGAQYPMSLFALAYMPKEKVQDIGVFAVPGQNAKNNGMTVWLSNGVYINAKSKQVAAAKKFLAFLVSKAGTDAFTKSQGYQGPYFTAKQSPAPATVLPAIADMTKYFKAGKTAAALEFVSPLKGPNLPNICVAVGTGQISAVVGAMQYDDDVRKQAQQLGLSGW